MPPSSAACSDRSYPSRAHLPLLLPSVCTDTSLVATAGTASSANARVPRRQEAVIDADGASMLESLGALEL